MNEAKNKKLIIKINNKKLNKTKESHYNLSLKIKALIYILVFGMISMSVMPGGFIFPVDLNGQVDTRVGEYETKKTGQNYYNYSDPDKVNIEVIVLGGVKSPGKYLVPEGTTFLDLISLTGGLVNDRIGNNIKFIRPQSKAGTLKDDNVVLLKYADLFVDDSVGGVYKNNPVLIAGDIIAVPIKPEMTTWETVKDILYVVGPLVSILSLIISILNYYK